jgi:hypothetical protein
MPMNNPLKKKPMTPLQKSAMAEVKARGKDTKDARTAAKSAMKDVKKAKANTPAFKAIMKTNKSAMKKSK